MYVKDSDGKWHSIVDQAKGSSCGPTCVRMVCKMATGKEVGEELVRKLVETDEGAATVSTITSEKGGGATSGSHNWGAHGGWGQAGGGAGSYSANLANVLKGLGLSKARVDTGTVGTALNNTTQKRPGIAIVSWTGGGAHFIVVAGKVSSGNYLILDPVYGLKYAAPGGASLQYLPEAGVTGTFLDWTVLTSE